MSPSNTSTPSNPTNTLPSSTELFDLGQERFDHATAEVTNRDAALFSHQPISIRPGRAPKGLESQVFAWNTFKYTTEERDDREELKGELHEGQLHRQNRVARGSEGLGGGVVGEGRGRDGGFGGLGRGGGGAGRGRGGNQQRGYVQDDMADALCAGKRQGDGPPLAKGFAEELSKDMFWDEQII